MWPGLINSDFFGYAVASIELLEKLWGERGSDPAHG